jgi:hypothetical protein
MIALRQFSGAGTLPFNVKIYTPDNTTGNLPAFIFFTGRGESGMDPSLIDLEGLFYWITKGWRPKFIVITVQINQNQAPGPIDLVQAALNNLADPSYRIDWNKWYMTGLSYGAATILGYIQDQTDSLFKKPAAVIPMSIGIAPNGQTQSTPNFVLSGTDLRFKTIPSWAFVGTADGYFDPMNRYWIALKNAGCITEFTTANEGHGPWNQWYDPSFIDDPVVGKNIYDWALQYSNGIVPPPPPPTPPPAKIIKSVLITYSDGTTLNV